MDPIDAIDQAGIHMCGIVFNMTNALSGKHCLELCLETDLWVKVLFRESTLRQ